VAADTPAADLASRQDPDTPAADPASQQDPDTPAADPASRRDPDPAGRYPVNRGMFLPLWQTFRHEPGIKIACLPASPGADVTVRTAHGDAGPPVREFGRG
jgi:hypothetical protein